MRKNRRPLSRRVVWLAVMAALFQPVPAATQADSQPIDTARLTRIDDVVNDAIRRGDLPGAVVLITHRGQPVFRKAFGDRALRPTREPMTVETIFDLASLTKVVATTASVMALIEDGAIRLRDPVARFIRGFERHGKETVTIEHLLTHVSGLRPDFPLEEEFEGTDAAITRAIDERLQASVGARFIYSDINFLLLGEIVARVSGQPLDQFSQRRIFDPLGMRDTTFRPSAEIASRIAPTEACRPLAWPCGGPGAEMLRGTVHDPTARRMGGVAGHAGLFGTADDLARYGAMLLGGGRLSPDAPAVLSPLSVARMTAPATPPHLADRRGLGWDIDSRYSANRGDLFSPRSFGHTGFTGTSIWVDPGTTTVVVFLSNRVHPDGRGNVTALRGQVATLAAAAVGATVALADARDARTDAARTVATLTGIDVLASDQFSRLAGRRVGLLTNHTGRDRGGRSTIDVLDEAATVDLRVLFSPEHGVRGDRDEAIGDGRDARTGLPVYSLYGETRRPTDAMLSGLDTVVVDLQDVGTRFYTYATTMAYVMEEAAARDIAVVVLDRPNPITGVSVEGPLLDGTDDTGGFTGYFPMPVRHGLTLGELARLFNAEKAIAVELDVVPMQGWRRSAWFDETGIAWVDPSPNLRSVTQATLYPGVGAIEQTNVSVGRGTDAPFERVGAPWIDGVALARAVNTRGIDGVRVYPVSFTPTTSRYAAERCEGIALLVTARDRLRPVRLGVEIAAALHRLYPDRFDVDAAVRLVGSRDVIRRIRAGDDPAAIAADWAEGEAEWLELREPYLLYE